MSSLLNRNASIGGIHTVYDGRRFSGVSGSRCNHETRRDGRVASDYMTRWRWGAHESRSTVRLARLKMDVHRASYDTSSPVTRCFPYFAFIKSSCAINSGIS